MYSFLTHNRRITPFVPDISRFAVLVQAGGIAELGSTIFSLVISGMATDHGRITTT
jgi:hypothetical protein